VLDVAAGQSSAGAIERTLSPRHPPMLVRPVALQLLWTGGLQAAEKVITPAAVATAVSTATLQPSR